MSKLYFYKCAHLLLFFSLSTILIHRFHSSTKIFTLIPTPIIRIPTHIPGIPTLIPHIPTLIPGIPNLIPRIPTIIPHVPIIPLIPFPDSSFRLLQKAQIKGNIYILLISETKIDIFPYGNIV